MVAVQRLARLGFGPEFLVNSWLAVGLDVTILKDIQPNQKLDEVPSLR